jgi:hypothetical protein
MVRWLVLKQKATTWTVIATTWTLTLSDVVGVYGLGLGLEAIFFPSHDPARQTCSSVTTNSLGRSPLRRLSWGDIKWVAQRRSDAKLDHCP